MTKQRPAFCVPCLGTVIRYDRERNVFTIDGHPDTFYSRAAAEMFLYQAAGLWAAIEAATKR